MYPFLRDDERGRLTSSPIRTVGVMLRIKGRRYFIPGATPELAMAHPAFPKSEMDNPYALIEFGEARGSNWSPIEVLKAPDAPESG